MYVLEMDDLNNDVDVSDQAALLEGQMQSYEDVMSKLSSERATQMMKSVEFTAHLIGITSGQTESWRREV